MVYKYPMHNISVSGFLNSVYQRFSTLPGITVVLFTFCLVSFGSAQPTKWVGTWSTAQQLVEPGNNPPSPGLSNNTLRQIVRVSIGGDSLRLKISNEFSTSPVTLNEVHIAVSAGGDTIDPGTEMVLHFNGESGAIIGAGSAITSDPFEFALQPRTNVAITIYFGSTSATVTGHPGSRTTSYLLTGNQVSSVDFSGAVRTDHWYMINTIDVIAPDSAAAVVILGNSITDGRGSGTNKQNRWPDELARRLQENPTTQQVAVLNQGIGGNCVLGSCLGPSALSRFNRDVIQQSSARWLIILEGVNDIGYGAPGVANNLIDAYTQMIYNAHANGIFVYGATILPFGTSSYYSVAHEAERQTVNEWIRNGGLFDAVIDLDQAMQDPDNPLNLIPEGDTGDGLHPNETGHRLMAEAVDLNLFVGGDSIPQPAEGQTIYYEPECATVGGNWNINEDAGASGGYYVTVRPDIESVGEAPSTSDDHIYINFSAERDSTYYLFARLNCPTYDDDSFWIKMDNGSFDMKNGLVTSGWAWVSLGSYVLSAGEHTLTIAYRENGAKMDKISISNNIYAPAGMGEEAENICDLTGMGNLMEVGDSYILGQSYPNPFNPTTLIKYYLPESSKVNLEVLDITGRTVDLLINNIESRGEHSVTFDGTGLSSGVYFYRLITSTGFIQSKKMLLLK
jgi:lysophospholipase L1-like esterase